MGKICEAFTFPSSWNNGLVSHENISTKYNLAEQQKQFNTLELKDEEQGA